MRKLGKHWIAQVTQLTSSVKVTRILVAPRCSERSNGARTIFAQRDNERSKIVSCEKRTSRTWDPSVCQNLAGDKADKPQQYKKRMVRGMMNDIIDECQDSGAQKPRQDTDTEHEPGHGTRPLHDKAEKSSKGHRRLASLSPGKESGMYTPKLRWPKALARFEYPRQGRPGDASSLLPHVV